MNDKPYYLVEVQDQEGGMGWYPYLDEQWATANEAMDALAEVQKEIYSGKSFEELSLLGQWYRTCRQTIVVYHENLS